MSFPISDDFLSFGTPNAGKGFQFLCGGGVDVDQ
jgi:hypothetical protein